MEVTALSLEGLKLVRPEVFRDGRGFVFESYGERRYRDHGIDARFVQDNHTFSVKDTVRGLHYRDGSAQSKLVRVARGRAFDVAVDIRPGSATFGRWEGIYLDAQEHLQLFIPAGFAHGFCVVSGEGAEVLYRLSDHYDPALERGLRWDDPDIGVRWPVAAEEAILSERDRTGAESFAEYRRRVGA